MPIHQLPGRKLIAVAIAAALGGFSAATMAAPMTYGAITLDATYALGGGSTVDGMTDSSAYLSSNANGADYYLYNTDSSGNNVFFHTYGFTGSNTYFGARASGAGTFSAMTSSSYAGSFTNSSSSAQPFQFSFHVDQGDLGITGSGVGAADLLLQIMVNGSVVARDHTSITQDVDGNVVCSSDDVGALGGYMGCLSPNSASASASGGPFSIYLGMINPGQTFTLDYDIIATVSGSLSAGSGTHTVCDNGYGGYGDVATFAAVDNDVYGGYGGTNCHEETYSIPGTAIARSGDPFEAPLFLDANGDPVPNQDTAPSNFNVTSVPEPGSLALMGAALAGLAASRRRKRNESS